MRADRAPVTAEARRAYSRREAFARCAANTARSERAAFVVAGIYDRRAIMGAAVRAAQARQRATGEAWAVCMSAALRGVWQVAKAARRAAIH
ncbi:hypothetical protein [Methylobacterium sp. AMS5]|uniref:hypothetical protein n=1 Tax=Methylobacterium sp. AMS5 TaxID=925818 RepID=UPI002570D6CB|nr:hypothetical protein [Methylobacterium sp. AMS5]